MDFGSFSRQFIFTQSDEFVIAGWRRITLPQGWTLHAHPEAAVEVLDGAPHAPAIRIGDVFNPDATGEIGGGRFVLLRWPEILPDAGALLALHYGSRGLRRAVASCPRLAALALEGRPRDPDLDAQIKHRSPINYIPMPATPFLGLRRLFHDQKIDLSTFAVLHRPSPIRRLPSYAAALSGLGDALCAFADALKARVQGRIFLPLTAGLDSRTLAAAFVARGIPFETVTLDYRGKPRSDVTVARAISRRIGVAHHIVRLADPDPVIAERFRTHTAGAFFDWDHTHIVPGGGYDYLGADDVMVVGACFDIGRQTAGSGCFKGLDFGTATGEEVWRRRTGTPPQAALAGVLDEWIAWRRAHPLDMDFAAAFYLDQRIGGWRSAMEHGYTLLPGRSICPANDPRIYSAMLTPTASDQQAGRLQRDVIARLAPELAAFPVNPRTWRCHVKLLRRRLRAAWAPQPGGVLSPGQVPSLQT